MNNTVHNRIFRIARREVFRIATRPLYLFCMIIAPLFCYLFFTTLMWNGLPTDMPAGVVDLDNTATTRSIIRNLDAFQQTKIIAHLPQFRGCPQSHAARKDLCFLLYSKRNYREGISKPSTQGFLLYQLLLSGSRFITL